MKRSGIVLVLSVIIFFICGAPTISFRVKKPSILTLPEHINSVGIIDRSVQSQSNIIEGGLTVEIPGTDKVASQFAIDGLINMIQNSDRLRGVRTTKVYTKNAAPESFPEPLDWTTISKLCSEFKVDAIIALEIFDSDYIIPTKMTRITAGFRFYDLKNKEIFDQKQFTHEIVYEGRVNTIEGAINLMVGKDNAVKDVSYDVGMIYGRRICPSWYTIEREYYRRPKKDWNLAEGSRMMEANNWDAAIEALQRAVETGKRKVKGRAAHDLAIVYEILGDYPQAKIWAQNAWGKYANKKSKNYSYILEQRIREDQVLMEQEK